MTPLQKKLWIGLGIMAALTPLGILVPAKLRAGSAWGEWSAEELARMLGYVPDQLKRLAGFWNAPAQGYRIGDSADTELISYVGSALLGVAIVAAVIYILAKVIVRNGK